MKQKIAEILLAVILILSVVAVLPVEAKGAANGFGDLSVTKLEVSQNPAIVGDSVQATVTALYSGNKPLVNCKLELYSDGITFPFDCNDLKSNVPKTYTTGLSFTTSGNYIIKATIDPANLIKEKDEEVNNNKQLTLAVKDLPNIKVVDFKCHAGFCDNGGYAVKGDPVGYEWTVKNTGLAEIKGATFRIIIALDGNIVQSQTYANMYIPANGYFSDTMLIQDLFYNDLGTHTLKIYIDADNQIRETIETDNTGEFSINVIDLTPPVVDSPDMSLEYGWVEQSGPDSITIFSYLKNNGPGVLDQFVTVTYDTDVTGSIQMLKSSVVDAILGPGEQMVISETFTSGDIPPPYSVFGYYHLWITADPYNKIPEANEDNNILPIGVCVINSVNPNCYPPAPIGI